MFLYGASGHAKVIIDVLRSNGINIEGIFDDNPEIKKLIDYDVINNFDASVIFGSELIVSIGDNRIRKELSNIITCEFGTAIHPSALLSEYCKIGHGTVVMHNVIIQSNAAIGKHVILNTSSVIEHDCKVNDFVHISPNATLCGNVSVGEGTLIGAGSVIIPGVKIGKWSVIGAGSVVIRDVADFNVVCGNPGKTIKKLNI